MKLGIGDEAWCFLHTEPTPGGRRTLEGAARVRLIEAKGDDVFRVEIVQASGGVVGRKFEMPATSLYACKDKRAHRAFGREVKRLFDGTS